MAGKLTPKQRRFAQEYPVDHNATQAAIRAGYRPKYAGQNADKLLKNTNIQAEIQRLEAKTAAKLEIKREDVLQELASVGFASIDDFVRVETDQSGCQTVRITDTGKLPRGKTAAISSIKQGANGIEVKLHDKLRALELYAKLCGMLESREAKAAPENNLLDAIKASAQEELKTDELQELEQAAAAGTDVVEPSGIQTP